ncbi:MAG: excinuclease ABC subunit C [Lewinellaceae bacterium]|nr:excinuclease ABC subunit C [Saprospiraceae bacterium]MCB9313673.1 excinuclease ABC subunit C [Lewinellaceae bacterium]HRW75234.1 excinuclease ABC subunit UvrC [Saprospiraceae bacterium]
MTNADYQAMLPSLPDEPGIYKYLSEDGTILYVGKAKNLKKRIGSYFGSKKQEYYKTRVMIKAAQRLEYTITETEHDALLLENSLIKKHQPRYNVNLKDDKSYSYICIKKERFPRVFFTRRVIRDGSTYFGPYTSKHRTAIVLDLIKKLFTLRTCALNLSQANIEAGKFKVCLEYHIKNCLGPCEGLEDEAGYLHKVDQIRNMLSGNFNEVKRHLQQELQDHVDKLEFEAAHQVKIKLEAFEDYQSKSVVVNPAIRDVDVFSIASDDKSAYVNYLKVINGAVINTYTQEMVKNLDEEPEDLLVYTIQHLRERFNSITPEVIVPFPITYLEEEVKIIVPQRGDKKKLLDMSQKNVDYFLLQKRQQSINKTSKQTPVERVLTALKDALHMQELPFHLECFDNSNIQGAHPVSSCVVFKNAKPSKGDYRHYHVKTVEGPNDFASMEEVVYRRYKRLLDEEQPLPQLIIIDGGKGQLSAAVESLKKLDLYKKVTIVGIAKRLEEIYFPEDPLPLYINKKSEALKVIQQARNEAHRFAITFHRNQRSKSFLKTELTGIPGVGDKTAQKLLKHFGSVKKLMAAEPEEWANVAGESVARKMQTYFSVVPDQEEE